MRSVNLDIRSFFFPAIALMQRLNYTRKLPLLVSMLMLAIALVMVNLYTSLGQDIRISQRQLQGLAMIEPASRAVHAIQRHRGIAAALLSGNAHLLTQRARQETEVDQALKTMEEKLPSGLAGGDDFRRIRENWGLLREGGPRLSVNQNFDAHTRLIGQFQSFIELIGNAYALPQDAKIGSFYLIDTLVAKLPHTLERLGQIRALGTGILSTGQTSEAQNIEIRIMLRALDHTLESLDRNLRMTGVFHPEQQNTLAKVAADIAASKQQFVELVEANILGGNLSMPPDVFLDKASANIDQVYAQMVETLLPATDRIIRARIAAAEGKLYLTTGSALLLFLTVIYFMIGNLLVIIDSIRSLTGAARAFSDGDLKTRVRLGTRDEFSLIGNSFNQMADGLNALLEIRHEDEARLRATIETSMDAVVQMDAEGIIIGWNRQAEEVFDWTREEAIGRVLHETIIPHQYRGAHQHGLQRFLSGGKLSILNSRTELLGLRRDGHEFPIELTITAVKTKGSYEFNGFIRDITQKKQSEELIWNQANFDALTRLPNRHMFHDRLEQEIKKAQRAGLKIALLYIDLDNFKEVNDTLGHNMGDTLLKEAARRISHCARTTDTVARMGGDEFTVILAEIDDTSSIERVTETILQNLAEPFLLGEETAYVSASIGITIYPDDATAMEDLLKHADQAMYAAKNGGRNGFSYFTPTMQHAAQKRLQLINELRGALTANQFKLHYQPIVDLASGRIDKAEALIRWQHPQLGWISPAEFIPLAEKTGLIVEIGDWVFREAARQAKRWRTLYNAKFQLSVNVSPVQFRKNTSNLCLPWFDYLRELNLPGQSMNIEITEGLLLDSDHDITDKLLECHNNGLQIAIDDFGTGYSSLSYLKKFDIDYLKIDQSFVRDLVTDPSDMALSEAIIVMAHKLGLKVIAEGVETEKQKKLLTDAGCDYAQGYLFSKPIPAEAFEVLLAECPSDQMALH